MITTTTSSYWIDSVSLPRFPKLNQDVSVDVIVVGGGIMGVTAAYLAGAFVPAVLLNVVTDGGYYYHIVTVHSLPWFA